MSAKDCWRRKYRARECLGNSLIAPNGTAHVQGRHRQSVHSVAEMVTYATMCDRLNRYPVLGQEENFMPLNTEVFS